MNMFEVPFISLLLLILTVHGELLSHNQIGKIKYGVKLEPAHHVLKRQADQPFRLSVYYDTSVESGISEGVRTRIQNTIIPKLKTFLESTLSVRPTGAPILLDRDCTGGSFFPSNTAPTIQCAQTCETNTICGEVQVPSDHLKRCIECNDNGNNCMDVGSDGNGVSNADFILYVSAKTTGSCPTEASEGGGSPSTIAFASSCQMESALDRPIAGNVNFCPLAFTGSNDDDFIFIVTKHEVLHALAFSDGLYPFWRDENGDPHSERNEFGFPPQVNTRQGTRFTWSDTTIREVVYNDWEVFGDTVSHMVYLLVTPAVVEEGRRHFNCPNLEGVELENQGGSGTMLSHWEKRILGDEFMTGTIGSTAVISNLSLALLKDSGWYQVNYDSSEELVWGRNAGCTFASRSCLSYMNEQRNIGNSISPFCDVTDLGCTVDKLFVGQCSLSTFTGNLPAEYRYFSQPNQGGSLEIADFCPFYVSFSISNTDRDTECSNPNNQPPVNSDLSAEQYGEGSRCFDHSTRWTIGGTQTNPFGAGCYQYTCNNDDDTLTILVRDTSNVCDEPGDTVDVSFPSQFGRYEGSIQCPSSFDQYCMDDFENNPEAGELQGETTEGALAVASCLTTVLLIGVISVVINF